MSSLFWLQSGFYSGTFLSFEIFHHNEISSVIEFFFLGIIPDPHCFLQLHSNSLYCMEHQSLGVPVEKHSFSFFGLDKRRASSGKE
jgi:hypothetical protein